MGEIISLIKKSPKNVTSMAKMKLSLLVKPNEHVRLVKKNHLLYFAKGNVSKFKK